MQTFLIRNARIVTQDDRNRIIDGSVQVEEGRIAAIGEVEPSGLAVVDAEGDYLIPGLIQTHVHLCQTLFRHEAEGLPLLRWLRERIWPLEAALDEESLQVSAELGIAELLLGGTTCILDMGTVHHQEVLARSIREAGIRSVMGKAMMDRGEGVPPGLLETTRRSLDESLQLAKGWHGADGDRIRYAFAPRFVLACSRDLQEEVGRQSREYGYYIHTHSSEHPEEIRAIFEATGLRNVQLLAELGLSGGRSIFAHGVHLDAGERRLLAESGTSICHCPSSNLKLGSGIADLLALRDSGVNVGIGADGAPCNNSLDVFQEMRRAYQLQSLLHGPGSCSAQEVLDLATRNGARALGWSGAIGSIEVGKDADLVRLSRRDFRLGLGSRPACEIVGAGARDLVRDVWVRGCRLVQSGRLVHLDHDRLLARGREELEKCLRRAQLTRL